MPVDEFGREIPAVGTGGAAADDEPSPRRDRARSRSRDRDDDWRTGGGGSAAAEGGDDDVGRGGADDLARDPFGLDARSGARSGGGDERDGGRGGGRSSRGRGRGGGGGGSHYGPVDGAADRDGGGSRRDRDRDRDRGDRDRSGGRPRSRSSRRGRGGGGGGDYYGPTGGDGGGGGGGGGRRRSPSPAAGHSSSSPRRRSGGGGDGGGRHHHHGGGHHHHHHPSGGGRRHRAHPSERYVDGPLLCEYLWKDEVKQQQGGGSGSGNRDDAANSDEEKKHDDGDGSDREDDGPVEGKKEKDAGDAETEAKDENEESANANLDDADAAKENGEEGAAAAEDSSTSGTTKTYSSYVSAYCLSYVRTFFNDHLDDAWFRRRYSPLERRRAAQTERDRKAYEARIMVADATESLEKKEKNANASGESTGADDGEDAEDDKPCGFVLAARLSGGRKPGAAGAAAPPGGGGGEGVGMNSALPSSRDGGGSSGGSKKNRDGGADVPQTHVHASVSSNRTVRILDVPCHVTDKQLSDALADHVDLPAASGKGSNGGIVAVYSTSVGGDAHGSSGTGASGVGTYEDRKRRGGGRGAGDFLDRSCFVVMESVEARINFLENLAKANEDSHRRRHRDKDKGKGAAAAFLELDVDCTDSYERYDIDADGKGSGPANADEFGPDDEDNPCKLPVRRATVFVATASPFSEQPTSVLSAAVSSSVRVGRDGAHAITIARALDVAAAIPRGTRLDDLLELLFPSGTGALESSSSSPERRQEAEDILDVTIAYLRRVHLFSFYNGCTSASSLGDILGGKHPAGTIHLRLSGADEILKKVEDEAEAEAPFDEDKPESEDNVEDIGASVTKDLLVRRLDESVSKALEEMTSSVIAASSDDCPVDDTTNALAKEIESAEEAVTPTWINEHALVDEDGRARCSFHLCRKLFKDRKFLEKHLVKKHSEHLRAEKAKCHDGHMMKAWDAEVVRSVPPVLVDCGSRFGMVPSNVVGAEPMAEDPEPGLWAKEEERRAKIEEEQRLRRERRAATAEADGEMDDGLGAGSKRPREAANFVDVDDMQDEKVELSFEAVEVPVPQPKKKKKKRKLL